MRFINWLSPVVYVIQGIVIAYDFGIGLYSFHRHHFFIGGLDVGLAVGLGYFTARSYKYGKRIQAEVREELERRRQMPVFDQFAAETKAMENLKRVMKATGTVGHGGGVITKVGNFKYFIENGYIRKYDPVGFEVDRTCIHFNNNPAANVPASEFIASAILLLKHDPSIFDRWKRQDDYYA
jgi:hypothetical protein